MDIAKIALIGGAAFIGWKYLMPAVPSAAPLPAGGILPASTPVATANPVAATTLSLLQAEELKNGFSMGNVHQHNYYYTKVRGVAPPAPDQWGMSDDMQGRIMSLPEYWSLATSNGLSGYRGVGYIRAPRLAIMEAE